MLEDVLDVQSWNEPGYRSLVFSDGWRAAMLNDVSRFYRENVNRQNQQISRPIRKGEIMALENGKIVATGSDITKMTYRLARSMKKKDSQFITVISGAEVSEEDAEHTTELVQSKCGSSVEVSHIHGGQPVYYYMLSVE